MAFKRPPFLKTAIFVSVVLFFGLQQSGGPTVIFFLPILFFCSLYAIVRLLWKKAERRARAIQLAAWVGTFALVLAVQNHWAAAAREHGDAAAAAVIAHQQKTGAWPAKLAEVGIDDETLKREWRVRYRVLDGKPDLAYPDQMMWLSSQDYDFEKREWKLFAY